MKAIYLRTCGHLESPRRTSSVYRGKAGFAYTNMTECDFCIGEKMEFGAEYELAKIWATQEER